MEQQRSDARSECDTSSLLFYVTDWQGNRPNEKVHALVFPLKHYPACLHDSADFQRIHFDHAHTWNRDFPENVHAIPDSSSDRTEGQTGESFEPNKVPQESVRVRCDTDDQQDCAILSR